jgi:hypothetical protein
VGSADLHRIRHVIVIMQENRSFDTYFGTFPHADGIPMRHGRPSVCLPDPNTHSCVAPFPDHADVNGGGPHSQANAVADMNGGAMNGFIAQARLAHHSCFIVDDPACAGLAQQSDVMGYHTGSDIPNYWTYARDFVLQDHMFEPNASWSLPAHLFAVSEWSAYCTQHNNPSSCRNAVQTPGLPPDFTQLKNHPAGGPPPIYAWTDLTYLLHKYGVSWRYYVVPGTEPDCEDDAALTCSPKEQNARTPGIWNPLPYFDTVKAVLRHEPGQRGDAQPGLEVVGHLSGLGRLGRVLRQHGATDCRRKRLRPARASDRDQSIRQDRVRRPPSAVLRRLRQVHRGRFPRWAADRPGDGWPTRPPARRA